MTRHDYIKLMNGAKDDFVLAAIQSREQAHPSGLRVKRLLLIAAVIGIMLALAGCAAHLLGLWDLLLPQKVEVIPSSQQDPAQTPYQADAISLAGFRNTPESEATAQWQAFLAEYPFSRSAIRSSSPGTAYDFYQVYDQTMTDRLEEILAQYGLKLHTGLWDVDKETLTTLVGGDFMGQNHGYGYIYEDGSFHIDGDLILPEYGRLDYQLTRNVRGTFTDVILTVGEVQAWQEWAYTTQDGTSVTLALSADRGLLIAQLPDSFVTVNILAGTEGDPMDVFSSGPIGREEVEALADSFGFSLLTPARPVAIEDLPPAGGTEADAPAVEAEGCPNLAMEETYAHCREAYAAVLEDLLIYRIFPDGSSYEAFDETPDKFALLDVNGDGMEELLLSASNTYSAGMRFYVMDLDAESGKLRVELLEWPALTFYGNGLAKAEASHNHGRSGEALWPYTLYRYDAAAGVYLPVASVDAWNREFTEGYVEETFPSEADTSGTGTVYYVMEPGAHELKDPLDISEYEHWLSDQLGAAEPIQIPWKSLTGEAIRELREQ